MIPQSVLRSGAWQTIVTHLDAEILALREKNDEQLGPVETAEIRGSIKALKKLTGLGASPTPTMQTEGDFGSYGS